MLDRFTNKRGRGGTSKSTLFSATENYNYNSLYYITKVPIEVALRKVRDTDDVKKKWWSIELIGEKNVSDEHNFFRKFFKDYYYISPFIGPVLEDRILELEEDLNHCLDTGDTIGIDALLNVLNCLYLYEFERQKQKLNNNDNAHEYDPETLFDDINYFKMDEKLKFLVLYNYASN